MDIDAGNELVNRIKKMNPSIGGFSGLYPFGDSYLVAGTDGVGTKLKLAFDMDKHDTVHRSSCPCLLVDANVRLCDGHNDACFGPTLF